MDTVKRHLIIGLLIALSACTFAQSDGWYHTTDNGTPVGRPIITLADFGEVRMDSASGSIAGTMVYQIIGQVKDGKTALWQVATWTAVGRQLAFVYQGEVICSPMVNMPLKSGNFAISSTDPVMRKLWKDIIQRQYKE